MVIKKSKWLQLRSKLEPKHYKENIKIIGAISEKAKRIKIRYTSLTKIPQSVFQAKDVGELDLASNNLRAIPSDIKKLQHLRMLNLSRNGIRCSHPNDYSGLSAELAMLPFLQILSLSECNLPFVPPVVWRCANLQRLDLSRNKIQILMPEIGNLVKLKYLNLQQTALATLPGEIAYCEELEELILWGNPLESLPETMKELHQLTTLAINARSFCMVVDNYMDNLLKKGQIQSEHIPQVLFEVPELELLDLEHTKLNNLPAHCYCNLQEFYLNNNYFQTMPKAIFGMKTLKVLDMSKNFLTSIHNDISKMPNLTILILNSNYLESLNGNLGDVPKLEELEISNNKIQQLPPQLGKLRHLKVLRAQYNKLSEIAEPICDIPELHTLDLTGNKIKVLPFNLYRLQNLKQAHTYRKFRPSGLWLHKNPITQPPEMIWKTTDTTTIFEYLRKLQISKTENLQRNKLIIIGADQGGKTSLVRALVLGKSNLTRANEDATEIVEYTMWRTENGIPLCIMDFNGDPTYDVIHPMLLDEKAMYLLVYDHRKYSEAQHHTAIGRWIDILNTQAPGAVVKLVGTQIDQSSPTFNEQTKAIVMEKVKEQTQKYLEKLQKELDKLKSPEAQALIRKDIETQKGLQALGNNNTADLPAGLPPYIVNLHHQKQRLEKLANNPLRVQPKIALVCSAPGIDGIPQLIKDIEIMAIDHKLFPHSQRYIPDQYGLRSHRFPNNSRED